MIVDCHSHIWSTLDQLGQGQEFSCLGAGNVQMVQPEQHLAASNPAEAVFVLGFVSRMLEAEIPNQLIRDYVAAHPGRMKGFAGVDPTQKGALEKIHQYAEDECFSGLVLSPVCQGFHPCATPALKVYELAEKLALPIYFLNGETLPRLGMSEFSSPTGYDEVGRMFPHLKMVISHLGFPWTEQTLVLLAKHPNMHADIAGLAEKPWQAYRGLTLAYEFGVIEKLLFASDFPNSTVKASAEALYNLNKLTLDSVLPAVPREQLRSIVERDSLSLLGLT